MTAQSPNEQYEARTFQLVECPYCRLQFRFFRSSAAHIDECGFESYRLECPRCDAALCGIIDPADDKLLLSGTEALSQITPSKRQ